MNKGFMEIQEKAGPMSFCLLNLIYLLIGLMTKNDSIANVPIGEHLR
jgi:hypothetical protein